ncbi:MULTISPECIES: NADPH:quinone reductase [unclassified Brevibacterium]|uniref:NADPH:quinone reductase n=1 Tax=unclassified Brevibacterium TaxID=2614124 RepID=UPI000C4AEC22|nr:MULTISPECIES: NADPH:quinone reductase [unclassified Brevibacterium]SMX93924.1 NADPH:quinone reductase [Brevibacterium sp. 239c]
MKGMEPVSLPGQMTAAFITATGGVEAIEIGPLPVPRLGPTDVLVRLEASEVNHVDLFVRSGAYRTPLPFPFVIGRDLVGTVAAVGEAVEDFVEGDRVWTNSLGHAGRQGSFAEFSAVPTERLYHLPEGITPAEAAPTLHAAGTAYLGLVREARLRPGETIVVGSASGAVGTAIVQFAAAMGAHVIAGASADDEQWVADCGADVVIDKHAPDYYTQVESAAPHGVDVWWDASGDDNFEGSVPLLAHGARVIVMAGMESSPRVPIGQLYTRDASVLGFAISNASAADLAEAAKVINQLLATGVLRGRVGTTFHLAEAAAAHRALEAGDVRGRILIVP